MKLMLMIILVISNLANGYVYLDPPNPAFDQQFYEDMLDTELCEQQLQYIAKDMLLRMEFFDAGLRLPKYILKGNTLDLGSYYPCLEINKEIDNSVVEGKYCMISVPLLQDLQFPSLPEWPGLPDIPWPELFPNITTLNKEKLEEIRNYQLRAQMLSGETDRLSRISPESPIAELQYKLGFCLPKTCTTKQALKALYFPTSALGLKYHDEFCRLPNDKPWVPADYVAVVLFSIIGILTVLSTAYDLRHTIYLGKDPKTSSSMCKSFSVYTNARRILTFPTSSSTLECMDGLRTLAMMWVVLGHRFGNQMNELMANPLDVLQLVTSAKSLWITAAPITVDTFFLFTGLLVVYSTAGKLSGMDLIKNLHMFYLSRILRMFPMLALTVLLQASILHRVGDGPYWSSVFAGKVERCRAYWWSTLLYLQNLINNHSMCLGHGWYLAVDMQLYIVCPIVLFWVLGKRRGAWMALAAGMLISLIIATVYNFIYNFPSASFIPSRLEEQVRYFSGYYMNPLTRAPPFFVGMIYGYILFVCRGKTVNISKLQATILWICSIFLLGFVIYLGYPAVQEDWNNQVADNLINSFMRPVWTMALGWIIFACVHGYGGPINWLLSLRMWKLPSRLSYAIYLLHYPLIFVVNSSTVSSVYFSVSHTVFNFIGDFSLAFVAAFFATLLFDSPFSTLIKLAMGEVKKQHPSKKAEEIGEDDVPRRKTGKTGV